jgi:hypothetical protein
MYTLVALFLLCTVSMGIGVLAQSKDTITVKESKYGKIEGSVIDRVTTNPLLNSKIKVLSNKWEKNHKKHSKAIKNAIPDSTGFYHIDSIPEGVYCVQTICDDTSYLAQTYTNVKIYRNLITTVNFKLFMKRVLQEGPGPDYEPMINPDETATIRRWPEEEINKLPGH